MLKMTLHQWICSLNSRVNKLEEQKPPSSTNSFLYGQGAPSPTIGNNGDLYLRFDGGALYKKSNNVWVNQGTINLNLIDGGKI